MGIKEDRLVESIIFSASKPVSVEEIKEATDLTEKQINSTNMSMNCRRGI
ncbi:MAG: hypothetical protein NT038_10165 [Euryarchaeota archaeon]|nr:hypothetical protein [Euryarchaeota archaeon]